MNQEQQELLVNAVGHIAQAHADLQANITNMANAIANNPQGAAAARARPLSKPPKYSHGKDSDWLTFRSQFEDAVTLNQYNVDQAKLALRLAMSGQAAILVSDLAVAGYADLAAMLTAYEARFLPPAASSMAKLSFEHAKQQRKESELHWGARLRALYRRGYPNGAANDETVIRRYIRGLRDPKVREHVLRVNPDTYDGAVQASLNERSVVDNQRIIAGGLQVNPNHGAVALDEPEPMEIGALSKLKCYSCNGYGHMAKDCRRKKTSNAKRMMTRGKAVPGKGTKESYGKGSGYRKKISPRRFGKRFIAELCEALENYPDQEESGEETDPESDNEESSSETEEETHGDFYEEDSNDESNEDEDKDF